MNLDLSSTQAGSNNTVSKQCPIMQGWPLVGVAPELIFDTIGLFNRTAQRYPGELVMLNLGLTKIYLFSHPDDVEYVFSTNSQNFEKGGAREGSPFADAKRVFGNSLPMNETETWARHRRLLQPSFMPKKVAVLAEQMILAIAEVLPRLEQAATQPSVNIGTEMIQIVQNVLTRTIFGTILPQDAQQAAKAAKAINAVFEQFQFRFFLSFVPKYLPKPGDQAFRRNLDTIHNAVLAIIRDRRANGKLGNDLLSLLLQAQDEETKTGMDDQQLLDECTGLFIAGQETSATSLSWFWYLLAQHPEIEEKLRAEVDTVLGNRLPTPADLPQFQYCRMVMQEFMRLYPAIWGLPRVTIADDAIRGYSIAAGSLLIGNTFLTHRLPEFWENPEVFDPERFAPERSKQRHRYAYWPFGGGPRHCIGEHFAMMSMQLIVIMMLQRWRLRCVPNHPVVPKAHSFVLATKHGISMTLQPV